MVFVVASGNGNSLAITNKGTVCSGPDGTKERHVKVVAVGGSMYPADIVLILDNPDICLLHLRMSASAHVVRLSDRPPS